MDRWWFIHRFLMILYSSYFLNFLHLLLSSYSHFNLLFNKIRVFLCCWRRRMKFLFYFCKQFSLHIYIFELNFKKSAGRRVFLWKRYFCSATWVERRLIIHISSYHNNVMHKIKFIWIFFLLPTLMLMMMICSVDAQVLCECTIKPLLFSLSLEICFFS